MNAIVSFQNVSYRIGNRTLLDGLSFELHAGETLVLLGRSGSGKTTALKMVNDLLRRELSHAQKSHASVSDTKTGRKWTRLAQKRRHRSPCVRQVPANPDLSRYQLPGRVPRG